MKWFVASTTVVRRTTYRSGTTVCMIVVAS